MWIRVYVSTAKPDMYLLSFIGPSTKSYTAYITCVINTHTYTYIRCMCSPCGQISRSDNSNKIEEKMAREKKNIAKITARRLGYKYFSHFTQLLVLLPLLSFSWFSFSLFGFAWFVVYYTVCAFKRAVSVAPGLSVFFFILFYSPFYYV